MSNNKCVKKLLKCNKTVIWNNRPEGGRWGTHEYWHEKKDCEGSCFQGSKNPSSRMELCKKIINVINVV